MAKVCLVLLPNLVFHEPMLVCPLGILHVASSLEENGHEVVFVDLRDKDLSNANPSVFPEADFYGLGPSTTEWPDAVRVVTMLREEYPKAGFMVGGPHVNWVPEDGLKLFDAVVVGDGELAVLDVVEGGARGVVSRPIKDLDSIPFPARHLLPTEAIFNDQIIEGTALRPYAKKGGKATGMIASRGCPFRCAFCSNPEFLRVVRFRSVQNVVAEVKELIDRYGCYFYRFNDDTFTLNKRFVMRLCEELRPLSVGWRCHTRCSLVDAELLNAMRDAGCLEVAYGVETADDGILRLLRKGESVDVAKRAVRLTKEVGIQAKTYWMVGLPKETWETVEKIKAFMRELRPDKWSLSTMMPFPGTDIYRNPEKYGVTILDRDWRKYWLYDTDKCNYSPIETDVASREELVEHRKELWRFLVENEWSK